MQEKDKRLLARWYVVGILLLAMPMLVLTARGETVEPLAVGSSERSDRRVQWGRNNDLTLDQGAYRIGGREQARQTAIFKTAPGDLPQLTVVAHEGGTGEGFIFMAYFNYWQFERPAYLLILDDNAEPVYYQRLAQEGFVLDFKKQPNGLLTYFSSVPQGRFLALDNAYNFVGDYRAGNGYPTDGHDLQLLPDGHALLIVYDVRTIDMSQSVEGGHPQAEVTGCIIQEIDREQNVVFEWQSWDHIPITDSNQSLTQRSFSYIHCNSVEADHDGNLLISSRHLDEVTKINRTTGEIIWRLGGKGNDFGKFSEEIRFNYPHDVRRLANGHITVFDNGVAHSPPFSRGLEYEVDETNMTVHLVREIRNTPDSFSRAMGNMQRLPNGNSLVGWGRSIDVPLYTEFDSSGQKVLEVDGAPGYGSYRVFRFPWEGFPTWPPALVAENHGEKVTLYFSWNGSTETAAYRIFGGKERDQLVHLGTVKKSGFESTFILDAPESGLWYFQVVPIDKNGTAGQRSKLAPVVIGTEPVFLPMVVQQ